MYRGGRVPVGAPEPPSPSLSTQQMLQPLHSTCTTSINMQDAMMCPPATYVSNTNPNLMSQRKELGLMEPGRPDFHGEMMQRVETKRKWTSESSSLDHSQLWLRRDQEIALKVGTDTRSKEHTLSRLFLEISQADSSRQWTDININKVRGENSLHAPVTSPAAAFRHDRNASASPSDHAMSEDLNAPELELRPAMSPDVDELKRTGSLSSEDAVDVENARSCGRGRSLSRNYSNKNFTVSKNLVSERKRRKKLNDGLYSLRALVPKISKMDKASIVGDAIEHVRELQQQIESIKLEIAEMESECRSATVAVEEESRASRFSELGDQQPASTAAAVQCEGAEAAYKADIPGDEVAATENLVARASTGDDAISESPSAGMDPKRILKTEVSKLEDRTYQLQISCQKGPGVLVQLTQALESMDMDVLNAYHTSFQERILNTFIVEMRNVDMMEADDVKTSLLEAVAQHGLAGQS